MTTFRKSPTMKLRNCWRGPNMEVSRLFRKCSANQTLAPPNEQERQDPPLEEPPDSPPPEKEPEPDPLPEGDPPERESPEREPDRERPPVFGGIQRAGAKVTRQDREWCTARDTPDAHAGS